MALDREGNLIVGTEPGGLVIRVLAERRGLRALSDAEAGSNSARDRCEERDLCGRGRYKTAPAPPPAAPAPSRRSRPAPGHQSRPAAESAPATPPTPHPWPAASDIYRIAPGASPEKLWSSAQDLVYALALDSRDRLLIGSGNKGDALPRGIARSLLDAGHFSRRAGDGAADRQRRRVSTRRPATSARSSASDPASNPRVRSKATLRYWRLLRLGTPFRGRRSARRRHRALGALRQSRSSAAELERVVRRPSPAPRADTSHRPAARFLQWKATLTAGWRISRLPYSVNGVSCARMPPRNRSDRDHAAELQVPGARDAAHAFEPRDPDTSRARRPERPHARLRAARTSRRTLSYAKGCAGRSLGRYQTKTATR